MRNKGGGAEAPRETTKKLISQLLANLVDWNRRIGTAPG
jgi:hypothetical protein